MARFQLLGASVGRKAIMALSGFALSAFLTVHLVGNLSLFIDDQGRLTGRPGVPGAGEHFQGVVAAYGRIPALLFLLEVGLAALFLTHIALGVTLWLQNQKARGSRYEVQRSEGGRTLASATMPYTGAFFIFVFLVLHLLHFRFGAQGSPAEMYALVDRTLRAWGFAAVYSVALAGLFLHLSHGVQSAFQSLGLRHPRWTPWVKRLGLGFALLVLIGFGLMPALIALKGVWS